MTQSEDPRNELRVQKAILQVEDHLVTWIQDALDQTNYGDLEESQFRNLVRVADTTESPEVIKNFLRYQVGRDKKWGRGNGSLAEKIIENIDSDIHKAAKQIADECETHLKPIWIELIRRYLGYGTRYLKYLRQDNNTK